MKNLKKVLSVLLATIMMLSIFTIGFTASAAGPNIITRVDIAYKTNVEGLTYDDCKYISSTSTPHTEVTNIEVLDKEYQYYFKEMVAGDSYYFRFVVCCDKGYVFSENVEVYINNEKIPAEKIDNIPGLAKLEDRVTAETNGLVKVTERSFADRVSYFFGELIASITPFFDAIVGFFASLIGGLFNG